MHSIKRITQIGRTCVTSHTFRRFHTQKMDHARRPWIYTTCMRFCIYPKNIRRDTICSWTNQNRKTRVKINMYTSSCTQQCIHILYIHLFQAYSDAMALRGMLSTNMSHRRCGVGCLSVWLAVWQIHKSGNDRERISETIPKSVAVHIRRTSKRSEHTFAYSIVEFVWSRIGFACLHSDSVFCVSTADWIGFSASLVTSSNVGDFPIAKTRKPYTIRPAPVHGELINRQQWVSSSTSSPMLLRDDT